IQDHKYFTGGFVESAANRVAFSATFLRNELNVAIATLRDRAFNLFSRAVGRVALHKNDFRVLAKFGNTLHRRLYVSALVTAGNDDCAGERFLHHDRSEEHTSELQSRFDLVCRLLLEKKK